jgi:hypothetical protein
MEGGEEKPKAPLPVRPSPIGDACTGIAGFLLCWFLIFLLLMAILTYFPVAGTTDAPVWARSWLYMSTAHLLDLWPTVAAPPPPPPPVG